MKFLEKIKKIRALKAKLDATDYKIIKSYEYSLANEELPYDIAVLHAERQNIRDEINAVKNGTDDSAAE